MSDRQPFIDPKGQKFNPEGGARFFEVRIPITVTPDEMAPLSWKWDSLLFPNKVGAVSTKDLTIEEAINSGLVDPNSGPKCLDCLDRGYRLWEITDQREIDRINVYFWYWASAYDVELCGCSPEFTREQMYLNASRDYVDRDHLETYYRIHAKPEKIPAPKAGIDMSVPSLVTYDQPMMLLGGESGCFPEPQSAGRRTTAALKFNETYPDENPKPKKKAPVKKATTVTANNPYLGRDEIVDMKINYSPSNDIADLLTVWETT